MYNIGDVVLVIDDLYEVEDDQVVGIDSTMCKYEGCTLTITSISEHRNRTVYRVEENDFTWEDLFFAKCVEKNNKKTWLDEEAPHKEMDAEEREALFKDLGDVLKTYGWKKYTDEALYKIIDKWYDQKYDLIEAFKKHPKYVKGKYMIAFDETYTRVTSLKPLQEFWSWVYDASYDYGTRRNAEKLYYVFKEYSNQLLTEEVYNKVMEIIPKVKISIGQKTSRAVNKICKELGVHNKSKYNAEYARYSDALNPIKYVRHTVISVHPTDFWLMSNGNSWCSCHTIDKLNIFQRSQGGCYANGTMSYMLDRVSMIYYTVSQDYEGEHIELEPKINRQVFCYGEEKLLQSRLYPQADVSDAYYDQPREIVEKVLADCLGVPNYWTKLKKEEKDKYIRSRGQHYRDYNAGFKFNFVKLKDSTNENGFYVGHKGICVVCGKPNGQDDSLSCCISIHDMSKTSCPHCGALIREHEINSIGGCYNCCSENYFDGSNLVFNEERTINIDGNKLSQKEIDTGLDTGSLVRCKGCGEIHFSYNLKEGRLCEGCLVKKFTEGQYTLNTKENTFTQGSIVAIPISFYSTLFAGTTVDIPTTEYGVGIITKVESGPWSNRIEMYVPGCESRISLKSYVRDCLIVLGHIE